MVKDPKNTYQDTPAQVRKKILTFKSIPMQYNAYLRSKGNNSNEGSGSTETMDTSWVSRKKSFFVRVCFIIHTLLVLLILVCLRCFYCLQQNILQKIYTYLFAFKVIFQTKSAVFVFI